MKNNGLLIKIAIPLISVAFIAYGFYVLTDYRLGAVEIETAKMDKEGCEPALQNKLDIALMQMSMSNIQAD